MIYQTDFTEEEKKNSKNEEAKHFLLHRKNLHYERASFPFYLLLPLQNKFLL